MPGRGALGYPGNAGMFVLTFADGVTAEEGQDTNRTTGSAYTTHAGDVLVKVPILLERVKWDIATAGTYTLKVNEQQFGPPVTVGGATTDAVFGAPDPLVLTQGTHRFTLTATSAVTMADNNVAGYFQGAMVDLLEPVLYDGVSGAFGLPARIVAKPGRFVEV